MATSPPSPNPSQNPFPNKAAASQPVRRLVNVEDSVLTGLARRPEVVKEFPVLNEINKLPAPKGRCVPCSKEGKLRLATFNAVKRALAGLPTDKKRAFKALFNAETVRVTWREGNVRREYTF